MVGWGGGTGDPWKTTCEERINAHTFESDKGYGKSIISGGSCALATPGYEDSYEQHPSKNFYTAEINHADGPCRTGQAVFSQKQKPCDWMLNMAEQGL